MNYQCREVEKSDRNCWLEDVEEVLGQGQLVDEELELEEVFSWLPDGLVHLCGALRMNRL